MSVAPAYSAPVWQRFTTPEYAGGDEAASDFSVNATTAAGDACLRINVTTKAGHIEMARFLAHGPPEVIASADLLCERLAGTAVEGLEPALVADFEGVLGLPAEKRYARLLAEDAIIALQAAIQEPVTGNHAN